MKKLLVLALCLLMIVPTFLVGCNKTEAVSTVKFGAGLYVSTPSVTDATEDKEGSGKLDVTFAAITVANDGKIVSCELDTASNTVKFTSDGKSIANDEFKTKYEYGNDYNMVAYGGAVKEWFEQAEAFDAACVGKTADEIAGLVAEDGYGVSELQAAGCTVNVSCFVKAASKK